MAGGDQPPSARPPADLSQENLNALRAKVDALESEQAELLEKLVSGWKVKTLGSGRVDLSTLPHY